MFHFPPYLQDDGFFLEVGAHDGEHLSNTLWLEKQKGWSGLLVEADPETYAQLVTKNRRAWLAHVCLSPKRWPVRVKYYVYILGIHCDSNSNLLPYCMISLILHHISFVAGVV